MKWFIFVVAGLFGLQPAYAFTGFVDTQNTSDKIYLNSFSASHFFETSGASVEAMSQNMDFRNEGQREFLMHKLMAGYKIDLNEAHKLFVAAGGNWLDNKQTVEKEVVGKGEYRFIKEGWDLGLRFERVSLSENLRSTSTLGFSIMELSSTLDFRFRPQEKWRLSGFYKESFLSDKNNSKSYDVQAMYALSASWPWIWVGYGATGLHFDENKLGYWSPKNFFNHGTRLDTSFPLYNKISGIVAFNYNFFSENNVSGEGYLAAAGLQWGQFDGNNVRLMYTKIRSGQNQNPWIYEGLRLSCQILTF